MVLGYRYPPPPRGNGDAAAILVKTCQAGAVQTSTRIVTMAGGLMVAFIKPGDSLLCFSPIYNVFLCRCSKDDCNDVDPRSIREVEPSTTTTKTTTTTITTTTTTSTTTTPDSSKAGALVPVFTILLTAVAVIASTS